MLAKEISVKRYVVRLSGEERERLETLLRKGKNPAQRLLSRTSGHYRGGLHRLHHRRRNRPPVRSKPHYTEHIIHLPDCYQVNDRKRKIAPHTPTRQELELPAEGLVFCCFNNNWKITPAVFDVWMRLLKALEGSVLWLLRDNGDAETNLRKEAAAHGIDPTRLAFAGRLPLKDHLARHRLADLFLDTLPNNAHTTASDALWSGLSGRVAASLLTAGRVA